LQHVREIDIVCASGGTVLRLDPFELKRPESLDDALVALRTHGARAKVCAGGTDLLPNMKHGLHEPAVVVHLGRVPGLSGIREEGDVIVIGAMTTLDDIAHDARIRRDAPGLARAASLVASPQLRRMGTLGGNLCLDTRCLYYNQTHFWRESLGFCLKKDGTVCHVVAGGKKCVAAASNDTATMLLALDAEVEIASAREHRVISLAAFYVADGVKNTVLTDDELVVSVRVKRGSSARKEGYAKLRHRSSIDYPMLSVAVRFDLDGDRVTRCDLVVSALAARPRHITTDFAVGRPLDASLIDELAARAHKQANPMTNICDDPAWRKDMVPVYVKRAIAHALDDGARS
jgi:4-hydroxybenzoyl-CoA reductase subunit beta